MRHSLLFNHVTDDNRRTKLNCTVETEAKQIYATPDQHGEVQALDCNSTHAWLTFNSTFAAQALTEGWPIGTVMPVLGAWGCGESIRRVSSD